MKIVTCEEFIVMPAGTVFAPCDEYGSVFDEFEIKMDEGKIYNGEHTFNGTCPVFPIVQDFELEFFPYDGDANDARGHEYFLILEQQDVEQVIAMLHWANSGCKDETLIKDLPGFC